MMDKEVANFIGQVLLRKETSFTGDEFVQLTNAIGALQRELGVGKTAKEQGNNDGPTEDKS